MKLSECSTNEGMNVLCELAPYIMNIASDEDLINELKNSISPAKSNTRAEWMVIGVSKITKIIPIVFKKRRDDVLGILAVMNEKTVEEVGRQNLLVTAKQIREIL